MGDTLSWSWSNHVQVRLRPTGGGPNSLRCPRSPLHFCDPSLTHARGAGPASDALLRRVVRCDALLRRVALYQQLLALSAHANLGKFHSVSVGGVLVGLCTTIAV